jgi:hypothetical protein
MSRSGYEDDTEQWQYIMYRGAVKSAIKGKRGQAFLKELLAALDAMEVKELIPGKFESEGRFCMLGVIGNARGIDTSNIDPEDSETIAGKFDVANSLAREIVYMNDEYGFFGETCSQRWAKARGWAASQIVGRLE